MTILLTALLAFAALYACWGYYLAVMSLYRAKKEGTLTRWTYALGLPILGTGLLLDCILNATLLTVVFMELPQEWLMTPRLKRHARNGTRRWSRAVVAWFRQFLDPFDPKGSHLG